VRSAAAQLDSDYARARAPDGAYLIYISGESRERGDVACVCEQSPLGTTKEGSGRRARSISKPPHCEGAALVSYAAGHKHPRRWMRRSPRIQVAKARPGAREANTRSTGERQSRHANTESREMSDAGPSGPTRVDPALRPLEGGKLLSQITNRIVSLTREHYRRGPIKTKTYVLDNLIVCVLSDGFTAIEHDNEGRRGRTSARDAPRLPTDDEKSLQQDVEHLTGCKVLAFLSQVHVEPDLTIQLFLMDRPLAGFGAIELADTDRG
jgi:uncharacterized protein YbcI